MMSGLDTITGKQEIFLEHQVVAEPRKMQVVYLKYISEEMNSTSTGC